MFCILVLALSACGNGDSLPKFRSYELTVIHPSPYSTFIGVSPASPGVKLPRIKELHSRDFNIYLRDITGCTVRPDAELHAIGDARDPSGYLVPIACMN